MFQLALVTLVLATGECPACGGDQGYYGGYYGGHYGSYAAYGPYGMPPLPAAMGKSNPLPRRPRLVQTFPLPACVVGCTGRNCDSCSRPLAPGSLPFDYRTDFNYPWSQAPCALPMAAAYRGGPELQPPGEMPNPPEEIPTPPAAARARVKSVVTVRRSDVLVSDMGRPLGPTRLR